MKYDALATDYDGTIASEGRVDAATLGSLQRARAAGLQVVLVTGRELSDLLNTFPHGKLFHRVVAENGAVLYDPASESLQAVAPPAPPQLVEALTGENVPLSVGHTIVATVEPYEQVMRSIIRSLGLEWHVVLNKGAVMALPVEVTKATGLSAALQDLGVPAERTVGIGDAENDLAFLRLCGVAAAVANALPSVKQLAQVVASRANGAGVVEIIDKLLAGEISP